MPTTRKNTYGGRGKGGTDIESSEAADFESTDLETATREQRALKMRAKAGAVLAANPAVPTRRSIVDLTGYAVFCSTSPPTWMDVTGGASCAAEALCCATGGDSRKWKRKAVDMWPLTNFLLVHFAKAKIVRMKIMDPDTGCTSIALQSAVNSDKECPYYLRNIEESQVKSRVFDEAICGTWLCNLERSSGNSHWAVISTAHMLFVDRQGCEFRLPADWDSFVKLLQRSGYTAKIHCALELRAHTGRLRVRSFSYCSIAV
jgi:hypothetical protein